jgi:rod shape-determining protein MreD
MIRRDTPGLRWASIILAFLFMIMPLPAWLSSLRPFLLALVAVFWILETPKKMGFGHLFIIGLLFDLASFSLLGEHALRLMLIALLVGRIRSQFRFYPVWQQALILLAILYVDLLLLTIFRLLEGLPLPSIGIWLSPVLAFLIWPWLYMLLDILRLQNRSK